MAIAPESGYSEIETISVMYLDGKGRRGAVAGPGDRGATPVSVVRRVARRSRRSGSVGARARRVEQRAERRLWRVDRRATTRRARGRVDRPSRRGGGFDARPHTLVGCRGAGRTDDDGRSGARLVGERSGRGDGRRWMGCHSTNRRSDAKEALLGERLDWERTGARPRRCGRSPSRR